MATENSLSSSTGQKGALPFPRKMPVLWEMVQGITVINTIGGTFTRWPLIDLISVSQISAKSAGYTSTPTGSERKSLISWPHNRNWDSARRSCSVWWIVFQESTVGLPKVKDICPLLNFNQNTVFSRVAMHNFQLFSLLLYLNTLNNSTKVIYYTLRWIILMWRVQVSVLSFNMGKCHETLNYAYQSRLKSHRESCSKCPNIVGSVG